MPRQPQRLSLSAPLALWLAASCGVAQVTLGNGMDGGGDGGTGPQTDGGPVATDAGPSCSNIFGDRRTQVCLSWSCGRGETTEGSWSGTASSCSAGDISSPGRSNALKLVNLYRFLADLPPVGESAALDSQDQACALMMDANRSLSHTPPTSWACYSDVGATAAHNSVIATLPSVGAVALYMDDNGNPTTIGHRRWILANSLGPVGIGSTSNYSCMWVTGGSGTVDAGFTAWPPAGPFPAAALGAVDAIGWTVQSDTIDLSNAQVEVNDGTGGLNVNVTQLLSGYGSTYAIAFQPTGWSSSAGHTYAVKVTGVTPAINYSVEVIDCP